MVNKILFGHHLLKSVIRICLIIHRPSVFFFVYNFARQVADSGEYVDGLFRMVALFYLYDVVVLLAFLGENILAVEDGFCADFGVDIRDFLFVDAHSVALNHLAAFAL